MASSKKRRRPSTGPRRKQFICDACQREFYTMGHLTRHNAVHTGERNHKCPFPGCETKCARQDNLLQHYRIHLSPGSRRKSKSRRAMSPIPWSRSTPTPSPPALSASPEAHDLQEDSPPIEPPPLEYSRIFFYKMALARGELVVRGEFVDTPPGLPPLLVTAYTSYQKSLSYHRILPPLDNSVYGHSPPARLSFSEYPYEYSSEATSTALSPVISSASTSYSPLACAAAWDSPGMQHAYPPFSPPSHSPTAVSVDGLVTSNLQEMEPFCTSVDAGCSLSPPNERTPQTPCTPDGYSTGAKPVWCYPISPALAEPQAARSYAEYSGDIQRYQYEPELCNAAGHGFAFLPALEYQPAQARSSPAPALASLFYDELYAHQTPPSTQPPPYVQNSQFHYEQTETVSHSLLHQPLPLYLSAYRCG